MTIHQAFMEALNAIEYGTLTLTTPDQRAQTYSASQAGPSVTLTIHQWQAIDKLIMQGDIGFADSYIMGHWTTDGMNINGKNGLACQTTLASLGKKVTLRPLPGMPVIRDLIVDLTQFYKQYESVKPYLQNRHQAPKTERLQSIESRDQLDGHYECILCACCTTACPSFWWNPDQFVGPAGLLWACRFILDSRDTEQAARLDDLEGLYRLYRCRGVMNCADVCPKGLNPSQAIHQIQKRMRDRAAQ